MKTVGITMCFVFVVSIGSAQLSTPDLTQTPRQTTREHVVVRRSAAGSFSRIAPMVSYAGYTIGGERFSGASVMLQYSFFRSSTQSLDLLGGVMFRRRNVTTETPLDDYSPLGMSNRHDSPDNSPSFLRNIQLGMGFVGLDYTLYLADGSVRPYIGLGGMLVGFPYRGNVLGTFAPDAKAGVLVNLATGFSGFAEIKHVFGLPYTLGAPGKAFKELTGLAFGFSLVPSFQ